MRFFMYSVEVQMSDGRTLSRSFYCCDLTTAQNRFDMWVPDPFDIAYMYDSRGNLVSTRRSGCNWQDE